MSTLYTYGYGRASIKEAIEKLKRHGVSHIIDVRLSPSSRNPSYRKPALEAAMTRSGLLYTHLPDLGNLNYKGGPIKLQNPKPGLRSLYSYVEQAWATGGAACILCVCPRPESCHRRLITDTLESMFSVDVVDLDSL